MAGVGTLGVIVWPVYIGAALEGTMPPHSINEPHNSGYERGQIHWYPVDDERQIVGRATIILPAGTYTHFVYFKHPTLPAACGVAKLPHPLVFRAPTVLDVDPIINSDLALATMGSVHP